jgi:RNA polymerase sigma-70 factor (ECF subfamily)
MEVDALYARHRDAVLVFLVRRTADTEVALDLWAETFAQAVAGRRRFRGSTEAEAAGWLFAIAKRQLALYYRRGRAERRALDKLGLERPYADDALIAEIERRAGLEHVRRELAEALASLSEPVRSAVQLRIVDELPYADVARSLRISEPAARARVSRGLAALADYLDPIAIREATAT